MKKIKGTQDADRLVGDKDDNILIGRGGDDVLLGRAGNDEIRGGSGDDKINAGSGDDTIKTGGGDDTVRAGQGNDTLIVNGGSSIDAKMGAGDDTVIIAEDAAGGIIRLGKGNDTVEFHASTQTNAEFIIVGGEGVDKFKFVGDQDNYTVEIPEDGNTLIITDANGNVYKFEGDADTVTFNDAPLVEPTAPVDPDPVTPGPGTGGGGGGPIIIDPVFVNSYGDLSNVFAEGELYAGGGNPSTGFAKSVNAQAAIELGLDVRYAGDAAEIVPDDGNNTWTVSAENLGNLRFAYSAAAADGLANYDIRLSIDTDGSEEENFLEFKLGPDGDENPYENNSDSVFDWFIGDKAMIIDDGGDAEGHVTQNIQALHWYQQGGLAGLEAGDEFEIKLEAFQQGTNIKLAGTEIAIKIDEPIDPVFVNSYGDLSNVFAEGELYAGGGNPSTGFAKSVNAQAAIELGLDVRYAGDAAEIVPDDGNNTWTVSAENLGNLRFAYSAAAADGLANYDIRLSIDTDGSEEENFLEFKLGPDGDENPYENNSDSVFDWFIGDKAMIIDDGGDAEGHVTQNIQALHWYQQGGLAGLEAGDEFEIKLQAFEQGSDTILAETEITIKIDDHTVTAQYFDDLIFG